jgi:Kef-type K+ transport system membrane component KefB
MAELPPLAITIATVAGTIGVAWAAGGGIARFGLPAVLGELAAELALGPSILGQLAPTAFARVFSPDALTLLSILAQAAVFLFMLLVGLELHLRTIRREARGMARIGSVSLLAAQPVAFVPERPRCATDRCRHHCRRLRGARRSQSVIFPCA